MSVSKKHFSKETREQQIIAASDFVLKEVGANNFTVDQVVEHLSIAKGTIYKYFKSKDDLLAEVSVKALKLLLNYFELIISSNQESPKVTGEIIMSCYQYYIDHPKYFELIVYMERPDFNSEIKNYITCSRALSNLIINHVKEYQVKGFIKKDLDPTYCNYIIWGSCMGMMNFIEAKRVFIEDFEKIDRKKMMRTYANLLVSGMTA